MTPRHDGAGGAAKPGIGHPIVATHRTKTAAQPKRISLDAGKQRRSRRAHTPNNTAVHVIHEKSGTSAEKMSTADSDHEQGSIAPADAWEPWLLTDMKNGSSSSNRQAEPDEIKSNIPVGIFGSSTLSARLHQLCITHEKAFRRDLVCEPARVPPMKFTVKTDIWHDKKNQMPPRQQTPLKNMEIRRQVDAMRALGIIRDSQASYWSQVLLTPKPNNKWRFCIDFRNLNEATESFGWPIPNIPIMLQRFGAYQAKFFAIFDFTQGYFQCPISEESKVHTAFRTQFGLYEWNRVPMGLKSAGSYFQHVMASEVLAVSYTRCSNSTSTTALYSQQQRTNSYTESIPSYVE